MKKALIVAGILLQASYASQMLSSKDISINQGPKQIATITALSPVQIISQDGKTAKIKIDGYVEESHQARIVKSPFQYEEYANFYTKNDDTSYKGEANPYVQVLGKAEDDYGEIWLKVSFEASVPVSELDSASALEAKAKELYTNTCSACHHLHAPTDFSVSSAPFAVAEMQGAGYTALSPDEQIQIVKYLQHNAKDANLNQAKDEK